MPRNALRMFAGAACLAAVGFSGDCARAQADMPSRVEIAFNRYYDYNELVDRVQRIARAYPELVELVTLGQSREGRTMYLAVVNNPQTGPHESKPAMWIDGNVHGNEIQAAEMVLYTLWYLTKAHGVNEQLTDLIDNNAFYLLVSQNPDGRAHWFHEPNTSSSSRASKRPVDDDRDGLIDEDGPDDLDGDGHITQMWMEDPDGRWRRSIDDPRVFERVRDDEIGGWTNLGQEGIDNDGDGRINEDDPGGDDMNRDWPSDWQPSYIQGGAGEYPLNSPETRAIADWILAHPNIAAVQSYHNSGGMILRGPGASYRSGEYPGQDVQVYNEIGRIGEDLLPYYRYMIIFKDLYTVHGGFVNWTAEGLGIFSFTNELWTSGKYFQRDVNNPDSEQMWRFRDLLQFGQAFTDYTEYDHPQYGKVLVGGLNKWASRNTPTFMLEEECHRNFGFCMYHADQMPRITFDRTEVERMDGGLWSVTVQVRNERLMPTRSAIQAKNRIGRNDIATVEGAEVVASGVLDSWRDRQMTPVRYEPGRMQLDKGVPSKGTLILKFIVMGRQGDELTIRYEAEKARDIETTVTLR